jgi:predicted RNA-binding Zn-ribbon protein involved in translation (DUF1610 family)
MPRGKVKRYFRRNRPVKKVPKAPRYFPQPPGENFERMSALTRYLMENEESGLTRKELQEQFHEYDCTSEMAVLARGVTKKIYYCPECGYIEVKRVY